MICKTNPRSSQIEFLFVHAMVSSSTASRLPKTEDHDFFVDRFDSINKAFSKRDHHHKRLPIHDSRISTKKHQQIFPRFSDVRVKMFHNFVGSKRRPVFLCASFRSFALTLHRFLHGNYQNAAHKYDFNVLYLFMDAESIFSEGDTVNCCEVLSHNGDCFLKYCDY